jgi:ABC-type nitrate/sulfonate/bicarbonate transport system permease component
VTDDRTRDPAPARRFLLRAGSAILFLALWEILPALGWIDPFFSSSPSRILTAAVGMFADGFWNDIRISLSEFLAGMVIAVALGIVIGLLIGWYRDLNLIFEPFITMMNAAPRVALIPLIILWLGIGFQSKVAAVVLGAFFPIVISMMISVRTLDSTLLQCARSFGANDRQVFSTLVLPNSVPFLISGLHIAIGRGLVGVVIGELLAARAGVGHVMAVASATFQTDKVFVGLVFLTGFGYLSTKLIEYAEKRFERWRLS